MEDVYAIIVGGGVIIAVLCIIGHVVIKISATAPKRLVGILLAFAVILGAIPAILFALYGLPQA